MQISLYISRGIESTIYREMNRPGILAEYYSAESYHLQSQANMIRNQDDTSPMQETIKLIEQKFIQDQWSPKQISNWLKMHYHEKVSHSWIYRHIAKDKEEDGELSNNLRRGGSYQKGPIEARYQIVAL